MSGQPIIFNSKKGWKHVAENWTVEKITTKIHLSYYCQGKYVSWSYLSLSFTPKLRKFHIQAQTLDFLNVFPVAISGGGQFLYSAQKYALKMQLFNLHILSKLSLNKYFEGQTS